jgi:Flp pilus assembly protein TadG
VRVLARGAFPPHHSLPLLCRITHFMYDRPHATSTTQTSSALPAHRPSRRPAASVRDERGQALVEFALLLPVLLLVVVGILSFGRAMNYNEQATHLANIVARAAAVDQVPTNASGQTLLQWVRSQADSPELANGTGSVTGALQVCVSTPAGTQVGNYVVVKTWFTFAWLPILRISPASTSVTRTATMRIEVPPTDPFFAGAPVCR